MNETGRKAQGRMRTAKTRQNVQDKLNKKNAFSGFCQKISQAMDEV
jgi:hypothetical protein